MGLKERLVFVIWLIRNSIAIPKKALAAVIMKQKNA